MRSLLLFSLSLVVLAGCNQAESGGSEHPGYFKQWFERHANDQGKIPSGLQTAWLRHDRVHGWFGKNTPMIDTIECLGPFNQGGRTRAILVSKADTNLYFAGAISGGLWRSENAGASWRQINDAAVSMAVSCITQSPFNPDEIYYGTGESRANSAEIPGDGIFKSTDHGNTFNQLSSTTSIAHLDNIWTIEHSLVDSSTVYAGTNAGGIYVTDDKGSSWNQLAGTTGAVTDILLFDDGRMMYTRIGNGIYMSADGSPNSFTKITSPVFPPAFGRVEIALCKRFPNVVYAAFERVNSYNEQKVAAFCKSSDGGLTWVLRDTADIDFAFNTYCFMLGVSPTDSNRVVCGGSAVVASSNGGVSWSSTPTVHADHHIIVPVHDNSPNFLMGTDGGLCRKNWFRLTDPVVNLNSGYVSTQYYGGSYGPQGTYALGGLQDNGSWLIARNFSDKVRGADGGHDYSQQNHNTGYVSQQNGATFRTSNLMSAADFTTITPTTTEGKDFINFYIMNEADATQLYYRTAVAVWRSLSAGAAWERMNTASIGSIQTIACTKEANPTVYFGGPGRSYRIDSAANTSIKQPVNLSSSMTITTDAMGSITIDPADPTTLYVSFTNYVARPRAWKVLRANTSTPQWVNISGNLPSMLPVNQIQTDPYFPGKNLFAGTDFGLYCSVDSGDTWQKESRVPNVVIDELKLRVSDNKLFMFTHGRGVWYGALKKPVNTSVRTVVSDHVRVYPNPVADVLRVSPGGGFVPDCVRVWSLSGQIVSEHKGRIETETAIDLSDLPGGTYVVTCSNAIDRVSCRIVRQ